MTALTRKLLRDVRHMWPQMLAVALVVTSGVAAFVGMRSVYESLRRTQAEFYERYRFADVFAQLERAPDPIAGEIAAIPGVAAVQTRVVANVTLDVPGLDEPATGRLVSLPERGDPTLNRLHIERGARPAPDATDDVLVSPAFAEANGLELGDSIGAVLNGRWRRLRIVGVALSPEYVYVIPAAGEILPDDRRFGVIWMRRDPLAAAFDLEGAFNDVALTLAPTASEPAVLDRLDAVLDRYGGLGAYGREDQLSHRFLSDEIQQNRVTSVIVPAIFMGVAAFLLNILLTRLVAMQREQIGVLKAFGYSDVRVGLHYLELALVPVAAGGLLGAALGYWMGAELTGVYARFYRFPVLSFRLRPLVLAGALAINGAAALAGALLAVRRAVRLPPAESMRPAPPPRYTAGVLERSGLQHLLSPANRIIARTIARRPLRSALTALGIGLAVGILVLGRSFLDGIDYMIDLQFRTVQREDAAVTFETPRPDAALFELARLPGVLRVEPFRSVPVRLRSGHRSYRTVLQGRDLEGELRRVVDRDGAVVPLPMGGLVLTTTLAEILGVEPGDAVTVEVLEGEQPVRRLPLAGTVDELLGVSAYMRLGAVRELLREADVISGAYLDVDPLRSEALYDRLKALPTVSGVSIREAAIASFEDTIAESLLISTTVLIVLAVVIAFGIVYNSARISLSERGRELATLRVLGFHRREVARILLGEQAVLTVLAVPIGFLLGWGGASAVVRAAASDLYRLPVVISGATYAFALTVVGVAAVASGYAVRRRLDRIDLIEVLKTRE